MKKLILILVIVFPFLANGQDYRVVDWKTDVLNVQTINVDTFKFDAEPVDYNDAGAITREIGNYFIDFVARCFKIIGSDANTITVVDLEHINSAPQSNQIGRVYQSVVDADSLFESIGGVDISVLDQMSIYRDVARNNEIICRLLKELAAKDTTGIYHANRQLLDDITPEDTTRWATGGLVTESDPTVSALVKSIDANDTSYWGRAETDPTVSAWAKAATKPTYTYSEVGAQPAGSYLTSEVDGSTTNEIQDLSRAGNTLSLSSDGTTVDLSDLVNPDLTGYRLKTDHDSLSNLDEKSYNSLTDKPTSLPASDVYPWAKAATKPTYTYSEVGAQPAGSYLTSEVDGSTTNEIQDLSRAGNTLSLSGDGTSVDLSDLVNPDLTSYRQKTDHDSLSALDEKSYNSLTDKPTSLPASDVYPWAKAATKPTYTYSEVGAQPAGSYLTSEVDGSTTNEIQDLSRAGNTLSLSGDGTSVDLSDLVNPDLTGYRQKTDHDSLSALDEKSYNSLTDKPASLPASDVYPWAKAATKPTYTYSEVGAQPAGSYLTSEVDGSTTNEIQDLSRAGNTLSLSGDGTSVDLSDLVNPDLTGYRQKTDHDSLSALDEKSYNSLTDKPASLPASDVYPWAKAATKPTYTYSEVGAQPAGSYLTSEVDGSTTNEIQDLSRAGNTLSLSGDGTSVDLSDLVNPDLTGYRQKTDHDSLSALDEKSYNSLTDKPASLPASDVYPWAKAATKPTYTYSEVGAQPAGSYLTSEVDGSTTNEIQDLYLGGKIGTVQPIMLSNGGQVNVDLADNDNSTTNEIQDLTLNGNILSLSGDGTPVDLSDLAAPDLTSYATTTQLADQLSQTITNGVTTKAPSEDAVFDALVGKATISGTDNYIMKKTGANTLGNSIIYESEGKIGVATITPRAFFDVPLSSVIANTDIRNDGGIIINNRGTGNRYAFIDFKGDSVYQSPFRIIRYNTGEDAISAILHRGKGDFLISAQDAGRVILRTKNTNALIIDTLQNSGFGTTPSARIHSQSTTTQLRLGYDATKYTDLSTNSAGTFNISPSGGFTAFSGGISASAFSTFTGQVEMTGLDVNLGASTVLRKNGYDIFTAPITMGACGSAGQVLSSTGPNSAPTWTTPATGSGSGITSIGMQVPTGLTVSPSALTSNGTFTIGLQSGYSIPTTANQTNWSTAYTNRITSAVGTTPLALSISNNTLSGYLSWTLTNINNATPAVGYLYYNGSTYSYQAATTTYTLPTASSSTLGGVKINGNGMAINAGGVLFQEDNNLTTRTPEVTDYIAFYDNSATAQGKMTLSTLGTLIGTSGGMVYPGAGIPVSTGSIWGTSKTAPSGAIVGTTDSQALTNKSVNGVTLSTIQSPTRFLRGDGTYERINVVQTLTSASSITMDIWNGSKAVLALATNSTITITNVPDGGEGSIEVTNSGAYTLAIAGSTGYTSTQKMGTVSAIASSAHTTVFYWRSGSTLYYGFLLNN